MSDDAQTIIVDTVTKTLNDMNDLIKRGDVLEGSCSITWDSLDVGVDCYKLIPLPVVSVSFKKITQE